METRRRNWRWWFLASSFNPTHCFCFLLLLGGNRRTIGLLLLLSNETLPLSFFLPSKLIRAIGEVIGEEEQQQQKKNEINGGLVQRSRQPTVPRLSPSLPQLLLLLLAIVKFHFASLFKRSLSSELH